MTDMNNKNAQEMCMDWNDTIENDGMDFTPLPDGTYVFEVTGFERARHAGSANLPACNKAALTLTVFGEEGKTSRVFCDLFLFKTMEWKLSEFFRSIGQKKHGERYTPDWNKVLGARGRANVRVATYTDKNGNERTKNEIEKFLDYDAAEMPVTEATQMALDTEGTAFSEAKPNDANGYPF